MANTYSRIILHVVFAVKYRVGIISPAWSADLYAYIGKILKNIGQTPIAVGGIEDHVHILFGLSTDMSVADVLRNIKPNATNFINGNRWVGCRFAWQEGYGAFSVSPDRIGMVRNYIDRQYQHHHEEGLRFKNEYEMMRKSQGGDLNPYHEFKELI